MTIAPQTIDLLMVGNWEGNVRQLCNEIQRVVARAEDGDKITPEQLSPELNRDAKTLNPQDTFGNVKPIASYNSTFATFNTGSHVGTLEEAVTELETQLIKEALTRHEWNISRASSELGVTRRGLYMKIARYGIERAA